MPVVMDADRIDRSLTRIAHEIVERNRPIENLALVGIRERGVHLAQRLGQRLHTITGQTFQPARSTSRCTATT